MTITKDILTRLQNGEKAEDIANEFVSALNDANEAYKLEQEKAKSKETERLNELKNLIDLARNYITKWYAETDEDKEVINFVFADLTAEKIDEAINALGECANMMSTDFILQAQKPKVKVKTKIKNDDPDAAIKAFLKEFNL